MPSRTSHILIVDDNPENIRVLGTILRQINCRLAVAQNGIQALQAAEEHLPDLILLDIMMPEMDGFEVCQHLKSNPKTKDIEIIFVTAAVAHDDELKGLTLGALDYIHKPYSMPIIQAKVALHLERVHSKKEVLLKNALLEENAKLREDIDLITRHDLKTPLNALIGYPQLMLMDDNLNDEQRNYLQQMLSAGNEMLRMINSSLDLLKMETRSYHYTPQPVDMVSVIITIFKDLRILAEAFNVKLKILATDLEDIDNYAFILLAERSLSYSLFANLIRNAIEACAAGDSVTVAMQYENDFGVISITNPGSVPESIRETFFEKYVTTGKSQGTGIGTYSAKLMAETQQGTIEMMTNAKETCISVRLPK